MEMNQAPHGGKAREAIAARSDKQEPSAGSPEGLPKKTRAPVNGRDPISKVGIRRNQKRCRAQVGGETS
jgi:hypothetical protein